VVFSSLKKADWKNSSILKGSGKRFWKSEMPLMKLKLVSTKTYPKGVMGLTYQPVKE
jgi:hypothetical protein